jgi:hypothetical protein
LTTSWLRFAERVTAIANHVIPIVTRFASLFDTVVTNRASAGLPDGFTRVPLFQTTGCTTPVIRYSVSVLALFVAGDNTVTACASYTAHTRNRTAPSGFQSAVAVATVAGFIVSVIARLTADDQGIAAFWPTSLSGRIAYEAVIYRRTKSVTSVPGGRVAVVANLMRVNHPVAALLTWLVRFRAGKERLYKGAAFIASVARIAVSIVAYFSETDRPVPTLLARASSYDAVESRFDLAKLVTSISGTKIAIVTCLRALDLSIAACFTRATPRRAGKAFFHLAVLTSSVSGHIVAVVTLFLIFNYTVAAHARLRRRFGGIGFVRLKIRVFSAVAIRSVGCSITGIFSFRSRIAREIDFNALYACTGENHRKSQP